MDEDIQPFVAETMLLLLFYNRYLQTISSWMAASTGGKKLHLNKVVLYRHIIPRVIQFGYIERKGLYVFIHLKSILGFRHCLFCRNEALEMICRDNPSPFFVMWPKEYFHRLSSPFKISKGWKQMFLVWMMPNSKLRDAFNRCYASSPCRDGVLWHMEVAIKNKDTVVTWPLQQQQNSRGLRYCTKIVYIFPWLFSIEICKKIITIYIKLKYCWKWRETP